MKHELEVCRRLVELPHQIPPIGTTIRTDETIELLPHNESAPRHQAFGPRDPGSVERTLDNPPVACCDRVEIPDRARHLASPARDDGQPSTMRERRRLESETESTEVGDRPVLERTPASRSHRLLELRLRHAGAVVEDADRRGLRMRVREQLDISGSRGQRIVDDIGDGGLQRITDVAQAFDKDRRPGRKLLLPHGTASRHAVPMAAAGRGRARTAGLRRERAEPRRCERSSIRS